MNYQEYESLKPGDLIVRTTCDNSCSEWSIFEGDVVEVVGVRNSDFILVKKPNEEGPIMNGSYLYFDLVKKADDTETNSQPKKHKHADLIKAWADGAVIQYLSDNIWIDVENPMWQWEQEYRIKPEIAEAYFAIYVTKGGLYKSASFDSIQELRNNRGMASNSEKIVRVKYNEDRTEILSIEFV